MLKRLKRLRTYRALAAAFGAAGSHIRDFGRDVRLNPLGVHMAYYNNGQGLETHRRIQMAEEDLRP